MTQLHSNQPIFWDDLHRAQLAQDHEKEASCWLVWVDCGRKTRRTWSFAEGTEYSVESTWLFLLALLCWTKCHVIFIMLFNLFRLHFSVNNMRMLIHATKSDQRANVRISDRGVWPNCLLLFGLCFVKVISFQTARIHFLCYLLFKQVFFMPWKS